MFVKQLSVFVENKPGRLFAITKILEKTNIDIRALSIADTRDFGILRLIVNDPEKACETLKANDFTVSLTNVIAIGVNDEPGGLAKAMEVCYENNISVEYIYAFVSKTNNIAYVIMRVADDNAKAVEILQKGGIKILTDEEIYDM